MINFDYRGRQPFSVFFGDSVGAFWKQRRFDPSFHFDSPYLLAKLFTRHPLDYLFMSMYVRAALGCLQHFVGLLVVVSVV